MSGPLEDVVVLDLTQQLAGPGGTMLLGDMGAVVIRVDPPPAQVVADVARPAWFPARNICAASISTSGAPSAAFHSISPNPKREKSFTRS
jgi:crotonobetainyl-CoA:carnitine CoA-transferase CaiB-like acyl-CoA transferase